MNISYDHYKIFYYVARYGSITRAAALLLNSQPNLTRAIKTLESALDCRLFVRSTRGVHLTPEGERLYAHIRIAFEQIEAGEDEIARCRKLESGTLSVAASEVALHCVLLPVLKEYRSLHPNIHLKISNHSTPQALDAIQSGIADLAMVTTPTVPSELTEELTVQRFHEVAVCDTDFPHLPTKAVGFAELLRYPLIALGAQTKSYELYSQFFAALGLQFQPETEAATADQILPMAKAGLGIGFVPEKFLAGVSGIRVIRTEQPLPEREIRIVFRKNQPLSIAAKELLRLVHLQAQRNVRTAEAAQ